jgi:formylglycine-generating enzyme required for sulfatase activity
MKTRIPVLMLAICLIACGTAAVGSSSGSGTVFALGIATTNNQVVLSWPTSAPNFILQSTTNLVSPAVWNSVLPLPAIVNGQNTVTNLISGAQMFYRLYQNVTTSDGMALIPAGEFTIGDTLDSETDAIPTNVYVSAFYMDTNLVSYGQWQSVYNWATNAGYVFVNAGSGKGTNYPVDTVDWYDCVKWCNARSQQADLTPAYYTDAGLTQVYVNGETDAIYPNWSANGYRLPTEAEWEKAARGGLNRQRFPWGDTICESHANYYAYTNSGGCTYDLGPYAGYNTNFDDGNYPYTSPVGTFPANGYGLYDMAGNNFEFCWDWYASTPYPTGSPYLGGTDPRGPATDDENDDGRVLRGGGWSYIASYARCAYRFSLNPSISISSHFGFRCVRRY